MELSSGQQRALFAGIVVVLAGLGIYLIGPGGHHGSSSAGPTPSTSAASNDTPPASVPASSSAAATSNPSVVSPTQSPTGTTSLGKGQANIYNWLPFTQQDLTSAAKTTLTFAADYGTWSYTESYKAYVGKMNGLITPELASTLEASYAPPGAAAQRASQKQVSVGSAGITQLASYGSDSITFDVSIAEKLTSTAGNRTDTSSYAVNLVSAAAGWEVNDIELASAGDFGAENP